jgi:hypothetical protein
MKDLIVEVEVDVIGMVGIHVHLLQLLHLHVYEE